MLLKTSELIEHKLLSYLLLLVLLTKACMAETSCSQLLLIAFAIYIYIYA